MFPEVLLIGLSLGLGQPAKDVTPADKQAFLKLVSKLPTMAAGHAAEVETSIRIFATDDLLEGARSFIEKREPQYHGR